MPENNNNLNNDQKEEKPIIEIPQSYYDKVAKEQQEKLEREAKLEEEKKAQALAAEESKGIFGLAIVNALLILGCIYLTVNVSLYCFFLIPVCIVGLSIVFGMKDKEKNNFPPSFMVGGIICAVVSFVISIINEDESDLYIYYSLASGVIGFAGFAIGSIITKYITNGKDIKALETIGYLIFFGALIGVPLYFINKSPEEFYKIIFHTQVEVKAETEEEFVQKTMKQRYNIEYTCKKTKNYLNEHNRRQVVRSDCSDSKGNIFTITSIAYNEGSNQYVVSDTYFDSIILNGIKDNLSKDLKNETSAQNVTISLYPEKNCFFYGDCVDCDEYYERYEIENDIENQYTISSSINLEKYLTSEPQKFVNDNEFKYIINIYGTFTDSSYRNTVNQTLEYLNSKGYKNNYGFIINLYNVIGSNYEDAFKRLAYKVKGDTNSEKKFTTYIDLPVTSK